MSTTQGFTYLGELKILRARSRVEAMTTNLGNLSMAVRSHERARMVVKVVGEGGNGGDSLVEDGDAAEGTAGPFGLVFFHLRIDGLEERTDEGLFEPGADN